MLVRCLGFTEVELEQTGAEHAFLGDVLRYLGYLALWLLSILDITLSKSLALQVHRCFLSARVELTEILHEMVGAGRLLHVIQRLDVVQEEILLDEAVVVGDVLKQLLVLLFLSVVALGAEEL